ncbi:hypothetical protein GX865_01285 [Candidatus Saccharibacteria bacterium]|jgi:hypothetical protein|nr:hypothetical protein [Candidatus Saccharibacteria bacterium]
MNEQFSSSPKDGSEQVGLIYREMIEPHFLEAKELMVRCQEAINKHDGKVDETESLQDLNDEINELGIFDQEIKFSAKIRPLFIDEPESLIDVIDEGSEESILDKDEFGEFAYLTGASGFTIVDSTSTLTESGQRVVFVIEDNFGSEYCILPEDIHRLESVDQSDETIAREVEAFYPEAAMDLDRLQDCDKPGDLIDQLKESYIWLEEGELRSSPEDIAKQLGRYATMKAWLDDASHNLVFSGDFSVLDSNNDFQKRFTDEDVSITADLRSVVMSHGTDGGDHLFNPELDVVIGMPDKSDGYTALRLPVENIKEIKSNRPENLDFIFGSDIGEIERPYGSRVGELSDYEMQTPIGEIDNEIELDSSQNDIDSLRRRFEGARIMLEAAQLKMDDLIGQLSEFSKRRFSSVVSTDEIRSQLEPINKTLQEVYGIDPVGVWSYTGNGIVTEDTVDDGSDQPVFGRVDGSISRLFLSIRNEDNLERYVGFDFYLALSSSEEISESKSSYFTPNGSHSIHLREDITSSNSKGLVHVSSMHEPPKHVILDAIRRRSSVIDRTQEMFGEGSDLHQVMSNFTEAINLSLAVDEPDDYGYELPIQKMQQALYKHPMSKEFSDLMTEAIGSGTTQTVYVSGGLQSGELYEGSADLAGVEVFDSEDGPMLHLLIDDEPIDMPLFKVNQLVVRTVKV